MTISSHRSILQTICAALVLTLASNALGAVRSIAPRWGDHFFAQQDEEKPEAEPEEAAAAATPQEDEALLVPENKIDAADLKGFEKALNATLVDQSAFSEFVDLIETFEKEKEFSPLGDPEAWRVMFEERFYEGIRKSRISGAGRVQEDEVLFPVRGELFAYEYSYIIPRSYDHKKRWPVILCLHDEGSDGATYLKKIWQFAKADKELGEGFILLAPDLREKTLAKKYKKRRSVEQRVEWFDSNFLRSIILPLNEIRTQFHCDPEKIFIEGVGSGADAAIELAAMAPGRFAGVISRHGGLRDMKLLPGLEGCEVLLVNRAEGPSYKDGTTQKALLDALTKARADEVLDFELAESEKVDRITQKLMGKQKVDPVIDGNAAIADFVARNKLDPYPTTLRIVHGPRGFRSHPLVKITSCEITDEDYLDFSLRFNRAKNRIEASGKTFFSFSVFLNDQLLDLDRPIEVTVNGVTLDNRTAERTVKQMLNGMAGKPTDYHLVLPGLLRVEIPDEPVKEEPKDGDEAADEDGTEK